MKTAKSINELVTEINRQSKTKNDWIQPVNLMNFQADREPDVVGEKLIVNTSSFGGKLGLTHYGHRHVGQIAGIPANYYDKMNTAQSVRLLAHNLNFWLSKMSDRKLVRALDGNVRAVLSDKYRIIDNWDIVNFILPILMREGLTIESCEITETRLYIKAIQWKLTTDIKVGEPVSLGVIVTNSEIGFGAFTVKPFLYFAVCRNGAVVDKLSRRKYHVGKVNDESFNYSQHVRETENKLFWQKSKELIEHTLTMTTLDKAVSLIKGSIDKPLEEPIKSVETIVNRYSFTSNESELIMNHLMKGGDMTVWGLGNAVTRTAQDLESYDRATEFETIGFEILSN